MTAIDLKTQLTQIISTCEKQVMQRAKNYIDRVYLFDIEYLEPLTIVSSSVQGNDEYSVVIASTPRNYSCTCPDFIRRENVCKHIAATALVALKQVSEQATKSQHKSIRMQQEIPFVFDDMETLPVVRNKKKSVYYTLEVENAHTPKWGFTVIASNAENPSNSELAKSPLLSYLEVLRDTKINVDRLDSELALQQLHLEHTSKNTRFYAVESTNILSQFCDTNKLRNPNTFAILKVHPGNWNVQLSLKPFKDGATLTALVIQDQVSIPLVHNCNVFGTNSYGILSDNQVFVLDQESLSDKEIRLITQQSFISQSELPLAMTALSKLNIHVQKDPIFKVEVIQTVPQAILLLSLSKDQKTLQVQASFKYPYLELNVKYSNITRKLTQVVEGIITEYHTHPDFEEQAIQILDSLFKNLTWSEFIRHDILRIPHRHIPEFIEQVIQGLAVHPVWELQGLESIRKFKSHRAKVSLSISSGIDWFEVNGNVQFGDQNMSLQSLLQMNLDDEEIALADGSKGVLPRELLRLLKIVQGIGNAPNAKTLKIANYHAALLEPLIDREEYILENRALIQEQLKEKALKELPPKTQPISLQAQLRPYQVDGFNWLLQMRTWGVGGILADDMGLGKTIQVIASLCDFYNDPNELQPSLLVVPTSLLHNWKHELERFAPHIPFIIYHGNNKEILSADSPPERTLIFTSYALLRNELEMWSKFDFAYFILDESQAIKNPSSQSALACRAINSKFRLAMTGTPIENNLMDLWSQFAFLNPGLLGNKEFFKKQFMGNSKEAPNAQALQLLSKITAPFYLRRTKEKVLQELPPLEERILYVDMHPAQKKLYEKTKEVFRLKIMEAISSKGISKSQIHIIEGMLRLRQIACDPRLYIPSSKVGSAKIDLLIEKLQENESENHKALVFSQFTTLLSNCGDALKEANIDFAYLDGSTRNRAQAIEEFTNNSEKRVFLISLKAGGTGLNLTCADYVFHLDPWWNPAVESQATGRAYRMGQKRTVQSIKMIASESIEEKILQLQQSKKNLADSVLQSDQGFVKSLDMAMVQELFW